MYAEQIIRMIDGPLFREQRRAVLQLQDSKHITSAQADALEGLTTLLDEIADCAYDVYGKDCMFSEPELECKAEEDAHEQRTQYYHH